MDPLLLKSLSQSKASSKKATLHINNNEPNKNSYSLI